MRLTNIILIAIALCWHPCGSHAVDIGVGMQILLSDTLLSNAQIGLDFYDISSDSTIFSHHADRLFTPASNLKLFTSAAALQLLGPSYRMKTEFAVRGEIAPAGHLQGDLIIAGGGDPLISGRFRSKITDVLELWADSLSMRGIREINGRIVTDNLLFKYPELGQAWSWDDLSYWYACPISALSFNDNCVDLKFLPGKRVGDPAVIITDPITDYITIHNKSITLPADSTFTLDYYRVPNTNDVTFFGGIAVNDTLGEKDYVSVNKPDIYCATIFRDVLISRGIKAGAVIASDSAAAYPIELMGAPPRPLFTWLSDSLAVIISVINKNSQNLFAEQTLKALGAERGGEGSFKAGIKAAEDYFAEIGITGNDLQMYDGSGLSYMNMVKPSAIIKLLKYMASDRNFNIYFESLANPARDRSLRKRLLDIPSRDHVRAKTGFIGNVSAFSGYIQGPRTGRLIAFSIMINNFTCATEYAETWQDEAVKLLLSEY